MVYSDKGLNGMSQAYHRLYRDRLMRGKWRNHARPILLNNWEATYFDFDEEKILNIAKKAKESGLYLGLVTMNPQSTLGKMADGMIILPGDSKGNNEEKHSIQPMGSQFEQMSFLIFDAIVLKLMENWNQTSEQMFMRHADLE